MKLDKKNFKKIPKKVLDQINQISSQVLAAHEVNHSVHENYFERERSRLESTGVRPSVRYMFHLTSTKSAQSIIASGFKPSLSFYKAFGRGVNLCPKLEDVLKYRRMRKSDSKKVSIIVSKVLVGKAHANSSDDNDIVREGNGATYSRPKHMMPKRGHDCMYSAKPFKQVWIIPSGKRVIPVMEVEIAD